MSLEQKEPGACLRFGREDIDIALRVGKPGVELADSLILDTRRSFLLSGENIFKALHVECPGLDFAAQPHTVHISNREAVDRLNAVGACFIDWPIYSYSALAGGDLSEPAVFDRLLESLKARHPILLFKKGDAREAVFEKLGPSLSIEIPDENIYLRLDSLEDEIFGAGRSNANDFPVVVSALGAAGRILINRLVRHNFPGFLLDQDNLNTITSRTKSTLRKIWAWPRAQVSRKQKNTPVSASDGKLPIRWEGPFLGHYSYAVINRELCSRLGTNGRFELSIRPGDTPFSIEPLQPANSIEFRSMVGQVRKPLSRAAEIHIANHSQHPFLAPSEGRWVVIQPWDYMSLPVRWLDWIHSQIDEVWVPSHFVRNAFLEAGIPSERVAVVPNGVDVRAYQPDASKVDLNSRKSFKFLFVGGPFWRKGFDVLLEAYKRAFTVHDDVSLVIKSVPEFWTQAGTRLLSEFRSRVGAPEILSIVQSLDQKRMAGLYAACNCLVHPYRAEGFAICVAEGMASGLPVIVTGMGATADFCNSRTAFLIPAGLRRFGEKKLDNEPTLDYPSYAEPGLDAMVAWMRYVYEHPRESRNIALEGMNKIRAEFTWDKAAEIASQRLIMLQSKPIQRSMSH